MESDLEMWEPRRELPTVIEISSGKEEEEEDWRFDYDMYGYGDEFSRRWSDEEDPEEDPEEAPLYNPESGSDDDAMEEAALDLSSDFGGDEDDEDFNPTVYDKRSDFRDSRH